MKPAVVVSLLALGLSACGSRTPLLEPSEESISVEPKDATADFTAVDTAVDTLKDSDAPGPKDSTAPTDVQSNSCSDPPLVKVTTESYLTQASPRVQGAAFYEAKRDRVVVIGGLRGSGDYTPDVVAIRLNPPSASILGWSSKSPRGWTDAGTAVDREGDRYFVVGGMVEGDFSARAIEVRADGDNNVAARDLPELPVKARGPAAGYDPIAQRLVVFGGYDGTGGATHHHETWVLYPDTYGPQWAELASGGPVAQEDALMVFVPGYGLALLASSDWSNGEAALWVMRSGTDSWEPIPLSKPWSFGNRASLLWDEGACRLLSWGGGCTTGNYSVELFEHPGQVTALEVPFVKVNRRVFMNAAIDTLRRRLVVHGGYDCSVDSFLDTVDLFGFK